MKPVTPVGRFTVRPLTVAVAVPVAYAPACTHTVSPAAAADTARWTSAIVVVGLAKLFGVT